MAHVASPILTEASTTTVTRSCLEAFQRCIQQLQDNDKIHIQTRLADLRLWADSVGATAQAKASLDWRFQHRPNDINFIRGLLSMLEGLLDECSITARNGSDVRDAITNIDSTVNSLAFIGVQIRRSGRKSRLRKADDSFGENRVKYRKLRAHLACVITSKPTEEGRPKDEGKEIHSVDYFADLKLPPILERLIEANLRRRHRFMEAQRHSHGLKGRSMTVSHTVIPQQFVAMAAKHTNDEVSPLQDNKVALALREKRARPTGPGKDTPTMPATLASGLDSKWGGLQNNHWAGSTVTRITAIMAAIRYPKAHTASNKDQKLVKCPCCCQAIPASELEDSRWRKHVANDLCPYTCVLEDCSTPYHLFATQKELNDHVMNDHPPQWQCPCCEGDPPVFKSLSGITTHMVSKHPDFISDGLEDLLSAAEINVMGISKCPLCDSEGPQDSPELVEHVFQHVHSFSLYSLPWPVDPHISVNKPVGTFDMSRAAKVAKDEEGNEHNFHIDEWAETVAPIFDLERGVKTVHDDECNELVLDIVGWPENTTLKGELSLQLCDIDRNPPKASEEELEAIAYSVKDYFSHNDYFVDESSDDRFPSGSSHSSQQTQDKDRSREKYRPKEWICTLCRLLSIEGDDAYFRHLDDTHREVIEEAGKVANDDVEQWKRSMLDEAYWNAIEGISVTSSLSKSPHHRPSKQNDTFQDVLDLQDSPEGRLGALDNAMGLGDTPQATQKGMLTSFNTTMSLLTTPPSPTADKRVQHEAIAESVREEIQLLRCRNAPQAAIQAAEVRLQTWMSDPDVMNNQSPEAAETLRDNIQKAAGILIKDMGGEGAAEFRDKISNAALEFELLKQKLIAAEKGNDYSGFLELLEVMERFCEKPEHKVFALSYPKVWFHEMRIQFQFLERARPVSERFTEVVVEGDFESARRIVEEFRASLPEELQNSDQAKKTIPQWLDMLETLPTEFENNITGKGWSSGEVKEHKG